jgi:microcystin-dependent protein
MAKLKLGSTVGGQEIAIGSDITTLYDRIGTAETNINKMATVPQGLISMWCGSITSIPSTWTLCDGTDGAPDLRDSFIIGAGGSYSVDSTGGASSVTLSSSQIPSHNHGDGSLSTNSTGGHNHSFSDTSDSDGYHSHSGDTNTTGSHQHNTVHSNADDSTSKIPDRVLGTHSDGAHSHSLNINGAGGHTHYVSGTTSSNGNHSHVISGDTGSTGGGNSHENRPPFYALAYIMKL